jgi:hypothetical protein
MSSEFGMTAITGVERFRKEYPNTPDDAFDAPIPGAYCAKLLTDAKREKRIGRVPYDSKLPVYTAWDLGIGDSTSIWFIQQLGNEVRWIDFYEASGVGLDHYVKILKEKPYGYEEHLLPHDAEAKDLGTGKG